MTLDLRLSIPEATRWTTVREAKPGHARTKATAPSHHPTPHVAAS
jgi:hypothetical protein